MLRSLVGSEMCIRDSINAEYGTQDRHVHVRALSVVHMEPQLWVQGACISCDEHIDRCELCAQLWQRLPSCLLADEAALSCWLRTVCDECVVSEFMQQLAARSSDFESRESGSIAFGEMGVNHLFLEWPRPDLEDALERLSQKADQMFPSTCSPDRARVGPCGLQCSSVEDVLPPPTTPQRPGLEKLIDPVILDSIEADVKELTGSLVSMFEEASSQLHTACSLSSECSECFGVTADKLCDQVESAVHAAEDLFVACDQLEQSFDSIDATAARIKQIRSGVDSLEAVLNQSGSLR
eukprot:TRINITY_DN18958_c0_g1_i1.p1 TRINITY_DN18958_c0_g1~~TRINITY_DN18958_c0_g1_i1.p1  ORF type:complete len:295 (-),score=58.01 TRINITY_DN18958_c0_g1_i1:437-1321(-)